MFVNPSNLTTVQTYDYATTSTGNDSYAITVSPAPTAYVAGQMFTFRADVANTGAATLNVNSLGARDIRKNVSAALATGDIVANQIVTVIFDGTNFQVISRLAQPVTYRSGTATRAGNATSGTQTIAHGLGTAPSRVRLNATWSTTYTNAGNISAISMGVFDSTGQRCVFQRGMATSTGVGSYSNGSGLSTTQAIFIGTTTTSGVEDSNVGVVSVDATNITITWTYLSGANLNSNNINIIWEVEA